MAESKRRRLAVPVQQVNCKASAVEPWLLNKTTFCKPLPLSGEGVVSVNIKRRTTFAIRIQPATVRPPFADKMQTDEEAGEEGYVEVEISTKEAILKAKRPYYEVELGPRTEPSGGLEDGKKVSYWFSFNRNDRVLKYGKGYIMEQTTLLTQSFRFPKREEELDLWDFIFRPDTTKEIVIKDLDAIEVLAMLEDPKQSRMFLSLSQVDMHDRTAQTCHTLC